MADIQFMNLGNALRNVGQIRGMEMQQQEYADQRLQRQRRQGLAPDVQAAMSGDPEAVKRIAGVDPDYAMKLAPLMATLDEKKQQVLKRAADFTTQAGMGVMNAPPELRPQAYAAAVAEAQRMGIPTENWPKEWGPQTEGWLHFNVKKAIPVATWFAENERTQREAAKTGDVLMSADGTITRPGGGGVSPYNIGNVRPVGGGPTSGFQQPASLDDGIRLAVNNVQAYPAKFNGGQPMTLLQIGQRWAPAGDGKNDPAQWARNVATIGGLPVDQPLDLSNPQVQAAFARGVHGAEHGAQAVQAPEVYIRALSGGGAPRPGFSPSPVPAQNVPGGMPQIAQGDQPPRADGSGNPIPPAAPKPANAYSDILSRLPPGAQLLLDPVTRMPRYDKDNRVAVQYPAGSRNFIEIPKPGKGGEAGPFSGNAAELQMINTLMTDDPSTQKYAVAYNYLSKKRTSQDAQGNVITIEPMDMSPFAAPKFGRGGQPTGPAPLPAGAVQQDLPNGGTITVQPSLVPKPPPPMNNEQARDAGFADRMLNSSQILVTLGPQGANFGDRMSEKMPFGTGNYLRSTEYQQFKQARDDFINAQLRRESGAAISADEYRKADEQYFPIPGDKPEVIKQKELNRRLAVDAMVRGAGPAYKPGPNVPNAGGSGAQPNQTYVGPDNKPILWKEIEDTAKARGVPPEKIISDLGLKPFGSR